MKHLLLIAFALIIHLNAFSQKTGFSAEHLTLIGDIREVSAVTTTTSPTPATVTTVTATATSKNRFIHLTDTIYSSNTKKHYHIGRTAWSTDTSECIYNGWTLNTHFNLPMIRYNFTPQVDGKSNLSAFNSSGFGIAINYGRIDISDENSQSLEHDNTSNQNVEFKNYIGLSLGCLFAITNSSSSPTTVFAPTINLQLLDLQVGVGYELGDVANSAHRVCMTFSYSIALSKLTDAGSWIISNPVPFSELDNDYKGMY